MPDPLRVIVKSPFSGYSGYLDGNDGFGLLRALRDWGCDVYPQPTWLDVPIPRDLLPLFGKTLAAPFDLLINHWAPGHLEITREARQAARVAIAMTMWEFSPPPDNAIRPCSKHRHEGHLMGLPDCPRCRPPVKSGFAGFAGPAHKLNIGTMAKRLRWYDMVLGYDEVSAAALVPYTHSRQYLGVLQGGFDAADWKPVQRDWHGEKLGFFMHGQLGSRKQPWVTIEAFQKLKFERPGPYPEGFDGAYLSLHTSAPGHIFPELNVPFEAQRIRVYCSAFDRATLQEFYAGHHVGVFPSRGEGKNLPALESMATGCTVAASDYGGHRQWLGADWAYPLEGTLEATFGDKPWAARDFRVSVDHLSEVLWHVWTHRSEAQQKATRAQELIPKMCDWPVVIENLFRRIRDAVTSRGIGTQIYDKAMACRVDEKAELIATSPWGRM
jgi:glycosyltransferase involved in cell wall biosynthesis